MPVPPAAAVGLVLADPVIGVAEVRMVRFSLFAFRHIAGGQIVDSVDGADGSSERDRKQRDRHQQFGQRNARGYRAHMATRNRGGWR